VVGLAIHRRRSLTAAWRRAPVATAIELACRVGYLARGFVYLSIGAIALLAAADLTPRAKGSLGALQAWADWPFGVALLWLTGVGLYGFAGWRALQALFDVERQGTTAKALAARAGQALSGVVYAGLAISVFGVLDALEDLGEIDDRAKTQAAVRDMLAMPGGEWMVALLGAFVVGLGIGNLVQAATQDFCDALACDSGTRRWAAWLGRLGHVGRGIAFIPTGALFIFAALHARAEEAEGLGGALQALERQPLGDAILAVTALGLTAFGLFAIVEARYRRMRVERVVDA
jgi:hypothetical protein